MSDYYPLLRFGFLAISLMLVAMLSMFEQWRFARVRGDIKRGFKLLNITLEKSTYQILSELPSYIEFDDQYVRKENEEVLLVDNRIYMWDWGMTPRILSYVGYVDLKLPNNGVEIRISIPSAALLATVILILFIHMVVWKDIYLPVFAGQAMLVGLVLNHFVEYDFIQRLLKQVERSTTQQG